MSWYSDMCLSCYYFVCGFHTSLVGWEVELEHMKEERYILRKHTGDQMPGRRAVKF
uniref:Uncharacterized protein n=1 Tax=Rhizophora mucronata TaxID=61149 RepID=A0A2P2Q7C2_RHIMU